MSHHTDNPVCPSCEVKLMDAHPDLGVWFRKKKLKYPNLHIAWSFRNQAEQNQMVVDQKSKLPWPKSKHNNMADGKPLSLALDLFQIDEDGVGRWSPSFFKQLYLENVADREPLLWGGKWAELGDNDHFEMVSAIASANPDHKDTAQ